METYLPEQIRLCRDQVLRDLTQKRVNNQGGYVWSPYSPLRNDFKGPAGADTTPLHITRSRYLFMLLVWPPGRFMNLVIDSRDRLTAAS